MIGGTSVHNGFSEHDPSHILTQSTKPALTPSSSHPVPDPLRLFFSWSCPCDDQYSMNFPWILDLRTCMCRHDATANSTACWLIELGATA